MLLEHKTALWIRGQKRGQLRSAARPALAVRQLEETNKVAFTKRPNHPASVPHRRGSTPTK
jgi:hypothetical protein